MAAWQETRRRRRRKLGGRRDEGSAADFINSGLRYTLGRKARAIARKSRRFFWLRDPQGLPRVRHRRSQKAWSLVATTLAEGSFGDPVSAPPRDRIAALSFFSPLQRSLLGFPGTKRQSVTRARDELLTASVRQSASSCLGSSLLKLLRGMMEKIFYLSRCAITQESATGSWNTAAERLLGIPCDRLEKRCCPRWRKIGLLVPEAEEPRPRSRGIDRVAVGARIPRRRTCRV